MNRTDLAKLSDETFIQRLVLNQASRSWSLGEIVELEKRGFELLNEYPELKRDIKHLRDKLVHKTTDALKSYDKNFKNITASMPKFGTYTPTLHSLTGPMPDALASVPSNEAATSALVTTAAVENLLMDLNKTSSETRDSLKRDPIFWSIFIATAISAVCGVVSLILTLCRY